MLRGTLFAIDQTVSKMVLDTCFVVRLNIRFAQFLVAYNDYLILKIALEFIFMIFMLLKSSNL